MWKKARDQWEWEEEPASFESKGNTIFPETYYTRFKGLSLLDLFNLIFDKALLEIIATKSDKYPWPRLGMSWTLQQRKSGHSWQLSCSAGTTKSWTYSCTGPTLRTQRTNWSRMPCPGTVVCWWSTAFILDKTRRWRVTNSRRQDSSSSTCRPSLRRWMSSEQEISHDEAIIKYFVGRAASSSQSETS